MIRMNVFFVSTLVLFPPFAIVPSAWSFIYQQSELRPMHRRSMRIMGHRISCLSTRQSNPFAMPSAACAAALLDREDPIDLDVLWSVLSHILLRVLGHCILGESMQCRLPRRSSYAPTTVIRSSHCLKCYHDITSCLLRHYERVEP